MLASRCCGREAILAVVQRAADDMANSDEIFVTFSKKGKHGEEKC